MCQAAHSLARHIGAWTLSFTLFIQSCWGNASKACRPSEVLARCINSMASFACQAGLSNCGQMSSALQQTCYEHVEAVSGYSCQAYLRIKAEDLCVGCRQARFLCGNILSAAGIVGQQPGHCHCGGTEYKSKPSSLMFLFPHALSSSSALHLLPLLLLLLLNRYCC